MAEEEKKEEGKEGAAAAPAEKKGANMKLFLIIGGVVLLLVAIGVPVAFMAMKQEKPVESNALPENAATVETVTPLVQEGTNEEDQLAEGEEALGAIFPLETFVVNLDGGKYVRLQAQIEFLGRDVPKRFYPRQVPLRDAVIGLLGTKTAEDLLSENGKDKLKSEIKDLVNDSLKKEEVKRIYFTQFVIQ